MGPFRSAAATGFTPRLFVLFAAFIVGVGCRANSPPRPTVGTSRVAECREHNNDDYYFPQGTLIPRDSESDLMQRRSVSEYYRLAALPSLSCGPPTNSFRLFWGGADESVAVTIIESEMSCSQVWTQPEWRPYSASGSNSLDRCRPRATVKKHY